MHLKVLTLSGVTHWLKWPGMLACGRKGQPAAHDAHGQVDCVDCLSQLGPWFGAGYRIEALGGVRLADCELEATQFPTWSKALQGLVAARKKAFSLRKRVGQIPRFRLVVDFTGVDPRKLARYAPISDGGDSEILRQFNPEG